MSFTVAAFYRFVPIADPEALRRDIAVAFTAEELRGTLLVAPEGINGTLAGATPVIDRLLEFLQERTGLPRSEVKFAEAEEALFDRLKIKCKREIITFHQPDADPLQRVGTYVEPAAWNALIADPEVLLLDARNRYEIDFGTFAGATDPGIEHFTELAEYVRQNFDSARHRKVAMFCTGGVRCEKASAWMLNEGFPEVYHLKGGILKYLQDVPRAHSKWRGECFVFDRRVSVAHANG